MTSVDQPDRSLQRSWLWSLAVRAGIIFLALFPFWSFPLGWGKTPFYKALQKGTVWLHDHVFRLIGFDLSRLGSPDVTNKIEVALTGALLWLLVERRRRHEDALYEILCVKARYVLGAVMLGFGLAKIFPVQFCPPTPVQLVQPLGRLDEIETSTLVS